MAQMTFETFRSKRPAFKYLFNSYYEAIGPRHPRPQRGLLSRPTIDIVAAYRDHVTSATARLIERIAEPEWSAAGPLIELGLQHEQLAAVLLEHQIHTAEAVETE